MKKRGTKKNYERLYKKFQNRSRLEITTHDYEIVGKTSPLKLTQNPDKTMGELMTSEELLNYLKDKKGLIEKYSKDEYKYDRDGFAEKIVKAAKKELKLSIEYLKNIGRLPKEFENLNIDLDKK